MDVLAGGASPFGKGCVANLLISIKGSGQVAAYNGGRLTFRGEDVLAFAPRSWGW